MTAPFTAVQTRVLCQIVDAWPDENLVLIGAAALGCHVSMTWRRTNDIDLTIVADVDSVVTQLLALGFSRDPKREHRWFAGGGVVLDVLPVTREAIARRELVWPESGFVMKLPAFDLLLSHTQKFELDPTHAINVATIPTIVVLKMAAWLDQPYERSRDLQDIGYVLSEYLADDADRRWDDAELQGVEFDQQGARALGIDIAKIAEPHHRDLVLRFVAKLVDTGTHAFALMAGAGAASRGDREHMLAERLGALRRALGSA